MRSAQNSKLLQIEKIVKSVRGKSTTRSGWIRVRIEAASESILSTVDSGNSKRLNSEPSLNSKRIFLVTPIVL